MTAHSVMPLGSVLQHTIGGVWGDSPGVGAVDVHVLRVTELKKHGVLEPETAALRSVSASQLAVRELVHGDLLLEKSGGGPNTPVGRVGLVRHLKGKSICSNFMQLMRPNQAVVLPRYLHLYLNHVHDTGGTSALQTASTNIRNIKASDYLKLPVVVPPMDEQQRIVDLLEGHLSRLAAADVMLANSAARQAGLQASWLASQPALREAPKVPLADLLASPLRHGRSVPTSADGFPVLRLTALRGARVDLAERKGGAWTASEAAPFLVRRGDFFVARGSGSLRLVGRGSLVNVDPDPVAYPDTAIKVRVSLEQMTPEFLALIWNSASVRSQIEAAAKTTAGIHKVNQADLARVVVSVPTLEEQEILVQRADDFTLSGQGLQATMAAARHRATALRRSLLATAFAGRLPLPDGAARRDGLRV